METIDTVPSGGKNDSYDLTIAIHLIPLFSSIVYVSTLRFLMTFFLGDWSIRLFTQSFSSNGTISNDTQLWKALKMKPQPWGYLRSLEKRHRSTAARRTRTRTAARWPPRTHRAPATPGAGEQQHSRCRARRSLLSMEAQQRASHLWREPSPAERTGLLFLCSLAISSTAPLPSDIMSSSQGHNYLTCSHKGR